MAKAKTSQDAAVDGLDNFLVLSHGCELFPYFTCPAIGIKTDQLPRNLRPGSTARLYISEQVIIINSLNGTTLALSFTLAGRG